MTTFAALSATVRKMTCNVASAAPVHSGLADRMAVARMAMAPSAVHHARGCRRILDRREQSKAD